MCGIAGIVDPRLSSYDFARVLQRMTDALIHRDPDDEGFFVAEGVGVGMLRLTIIDVAGDSQPTATDGELRLIVRG